MSNMNSVAVAYKNKRMNITLGIGQGSHVSRADEADRLAKPRLIKLTGAIEGQGVFDGSDDVLIYTTGELERDYKWITNKPKINGVELEGNMTSDDLGIQPAGDYPEETLDYNDIDEIIDLEPINPEDVYPITDDEIDDVIGGDEEEDDDEKAMSHEDIDEILNQ